MTMRSLGSVVASLAYKEKLSPELWEILRNGMERQNFDRESGYSFQRENPEPEAIIDGLKLCDSPIEKIMLIGMMTMQTPTLPVVHDPMSGEAFPEAPVVITPQFNIARYRLDFLVTVQRKTEPMNFAVECDGIEFHGGIQARKADHERDTYLRALGIKTIRYYGQTIKKLGYKCADEIAAVVNEELEAA